jgi:hypothetical protein
MAPEVDIRGLEVVVAAIHEMWRELALMGGWKV